jgi:hypothetical protein
MTQIVKKQLDNQMVKAIGITQIAKKAIETTQMGDCF